MCLRKLCLQSAKGDKRPVFPAVCLMSKWLTCYAGAKAQLVVVICHL